MFENNLLNCRFAAAKLYACRRIAKLKPTASAKLNSPISSAKPNIACEANLAGQRPI